MPFWSFIANRRSLIVSFVFASIFSISLITYNLSLITAQSPTPIEKAQSDYNFQFTKYNDAHEKYLSAKASYLSFKTAVSKNEAFEKTKDHLIQVDQLYLALIALSQEFGNSMNWNKSTLKKDDINKLLKSEVDYFNEHKQKVEKTHTLEELPPLSAELKAHINGITQPKLNKATATYQVVETEAALDDFNSLSNILDRIVVFKLRAGQTQSILANWSSEIKDIREKTTTQTQNASSRLSQYKEDLLSTGGLNELTTITQNAHTQLRRSKPLFEELTRIL